MKNIISEIILFDKPISLSEEIRYPWNLINKISKGHRK